MSRVGPAFAEPNQTGDKRHHGEQSDGNPQNRQPEFGVREYREKSKVGWQMVHWHRCRHTRGKERVAEVANFLPTFRNRQRADRHVEPSWAQSVKIPDKIRPPKFVIEAEFVGNLPP